MMPQKTASNYLELDSNNETEEGAMKSHNFQNADYAKIYAYSQGGGMSNRNSMNVNRMQQHDTSDDNEDNHEVMVKVEKKESSLVNGLSSTVSNDGTCNALFNHYLSIALKQQQQGQEIDVHSLEMLSQF